MAYPIDGLTGKITSWGTTGDDVYQLINTALRPVEFSISANGNAWDSTALDATGTAMEKTGGLFEGTFNFSGLWPLTSPVMGNTGLVTLGTAAYNYFARMWNLNIDFGEYDITPFASGGVTSKQFRPAGRIEWDCGWTARMSNAAYPLMPTAANSAGTSIALKLKETGATDAAFTGNVVVDTMTKTVTVARNLIDVAYTAKGNGTLTMVEGSSGGPAILPAGAIDTATWDTNTDGTGDVTVILQTATSRTLTAAAFLRSLRVEVQIDQPIKISGVGRFTGDVTTA